MATNDVSKSTSNNVPEWPECVQSRAKVAWGKWRELDMRTVNVRSKDYMKTRQKEASDVSLLKLAYVDIFTYDDYKDSNHVALQPDSWYYQNWDKLAPETFHFIVNFQLSSIKQCIACYFVLNTKELPPWMIQEMRNDLINEQQRNNTSNMNNSNDIRKNQPSMRQLSQWSQLSTSSANDGANDKILNTMYHPTAHKASIDPSSNLMTDNAMFLMKPSAETLVATGNLNSIDDEYRNPWKSVAYSKLPIPKSTVIKLRLNKTKNTFETNGNSKIYDLNIGMAIENETKSNEIDNGDESKSSNNNNIRFTPEREEDTPSIDTIKNYSQANLKGDSVDPLSANTKLNNMSVDSLEDSFQPNSDPNILITNGTNIVGNNNSNSTNNNNNNNNNNISKKNDSNNYNQYLSDLWKRHTSISATNDSANVAYSSLTSRDVECMIESPILLHSIENPDSMLFVLPKQIIGDANTVFPNQASNKNSNNSDNSNSNSNNMNNNNKNQNNDYTNIDNNNGTTQNENENNINSRNRSGSKLKVLRRKFSSGNETKNDNENSPNGENTDESKSKWTNEDNNIKDEIDDNGNGKNVKNIKNDKNERKEKDSDNNETIDTLLWVPPCGYEPLDKSNIWSSFLSGDSSVIDERFKFIPAVNYNYGKDSDDEEDSELSSKKAGSECKDNENDSSGTSTPKSSQSEPQTQQTQQAQQAQQQQNQTQSRGWGWGSKLSSLGQMSVSSSLSSLRSVKKAVVNTVTSVGSSAAVTASMNWLKNTVIKPAILGRHCEQRTIRGHNYLEIDCRADGTMVGRNAVQKSWSLMTMINVEMVFVIEGRSSNELPERCVGGCKLSGLKVDGNSKKLKSREWIENEMQFYYQNIKNKIEKQQRKLGTKMNNNNNNNNNDKNSNDASDEAEPLETFGKNDSYQKELTNVDGIEYKKIELENGNMTHKASNLKMSSTGDVDTLQLDSGFATEDSVSFTNSKKKENLTKINDDTDTEDRNDLNTTRVSLDFGSKRESLSLE